MFVRIMGKDTRPVLAAAASPIRMTVAERRRCFIGEDSLAGYFPDALCLAGDIEFPKFFASVSGV